MYCIDLYNYKIKIKASIKYCLARLPAISSHWCKFTCLCWSGVSTWIGQYMYMICTIVSTFSIYIYNSDYKIVCIHDQSNFFNAHYDKTFVFREHWFVSLTQPQRSWWWSYAEVLTQPHSTGLFFTYQLITILYSN